MSSCFSAIPFRSFTPPSRPAAGHSSIWKSASRCSPSHVTSDIDSTRQACILQICQDDKPLAQVTRSSQNENTVGSCQPSHDTGNELHACIGSMIDLWVEPDRAIGTTPPGPLGLVLFRKHTKLKYQNGCISTTEPIGDADATCRAQNFPSKRVKYHGMTPRPCARINEHKPCNCVCASAYPVKLLRVPTCS